MCTSRPCVVISNRLQLCTAAVTLRVGDTPVRDLHLGTTLIRVVSSKPSASKLCPRKWCVPRSTRARHGSDERGVGRIVEKRGGETVGLLRSEDPMRGCNVTVVGPPESKVASHL